MNEAASTAGKTMHFKNVRDNKCADVQNTMPVNGLCCVCRKQPIHKRMYFGRLFCIECFHKYIWTSPNKDCSGDIIKVQDVPAQNVPVQDTTE